MMAEQAESSVCPKCSELERRVAALESQLADALSRLAAATKNSGNSSKPPSSDSAKAAVVDRKKKRKKGAQPGRPKHERLAFPPEQVDKTQDYAFDACPECGGKLEVLDQPASGVLGCDYFSAYPKYMRLNENVLVQFCLAHLIRDVRFLVDQRH